MAGGDTTRAEQQATRKRVFELRRQEFREAARRGASDAALDRLEEEMWRSKFAIWLNGKD